MARIWFGVIGLVIPIFIAVMHGSWIAVALVVWANAVGFIEGMYVKYQSLKVKK